LTWASVEREGVGMGSGKGLTTGGEGWEGIVNQYNEKWKGLPRLCSGEGGMGAQSGIRRGLLSPWENKESKNWCKKG